MERPPSGRFADSTNAFWRQRRSNGCERRPLPCQGVVEFVGRCLCYDRGVTEDRFMPITLDRIDHIVLNCRDAETTISWYQRVLGMSKEEFGPERRIALRFGDQKFNVRPTGAPNWNTAETDAPGSLDLCFVTRTPLAHVIEHLHACGVVIV